MNDIDLNDKDFICYCSGTTKEKIKELINNGIDDLDSISKLTGACAGCGSCETAVSELIAEYSQSGVLQTDEVLQS
ncbi:(2Fe-2S)-binding protein [Methylobacter sp. Wu1]|jgi:bacterioferritin-associated ferredoxin|uniref:(2Fe-2S)-binding protein n=1 Tax=Methylobacter sp. Wu1 TaxID=3119359 RepID=UPI002F956F8A